MQVEHSADAETASGAAAGFLESEPVRHNVVLSVLDERRASPRPGHYWWASDDGRVVGFAMQSPTGFDVGLTPAPPEVIDALAGAVHETAAEVPGVVGEAAASARFAGRWTELAACGARPREGQLLYELDTAPDVAVVDTRTATAADLELITRWTTAFATETGLDGPDHPRQAAADMIGAGRLHLACDNARPVAMTRATAPAAGASRVGWVYTPPAERGRGYATRLVAHVSATVLREGADRCLLFTQLSNPVSNAIYRRIGYRPIGEILAFTFDAGR